MFGVWEEHSSVDKTSEHKDLCRWLKQFPTTQKTHSSLHCKTKSSLEVPWRQRPHSHFSFEVAHIYSCWFNTAVYNSVCPIRDARFLSTLPRSKFKRFHNVWVLTQNPVTETPGQSTHGLSRSTDTDIWDSALHTANGEKVHPLRSTQITQNKKVKSSWGRKSLTPVSVQRKLGVVALIY